MPIPKKPRKHHCDWCGQLIDRPPSTRTGLHKFCGKQCQGAFSSAEYHRDRPRITCEACGEVFTVPVCRANGRRYCSRECAGKGHGAAIMGRRKLGSRVVVACTECGKLVEKYAYRIKATLKPFCNRSCRGAYRSKHEHGQNSPLWKGGGGGRNRGQQHLWAGTIKMRANWACEMCGKTKRLHAHHLLAYAPNHDRGLDLDNGICLCYDCHRAVHRGEIVPQRRLSL